MRLLKILLWISFPVFVVALAASLLTTRPYMQLSKGLYDSHEAIEYDHDYVSGELMDYLNYKRDDLNFGPNAETEGPVLRDIEIRHMEDVKDVYTGVRIAGLLALVAFVASGLVLYKKDIHFFYKSLKNIYILPAFVILFIGGWFIIDFSLVFTIFHQLFFTNDDWILYSDDVLIQLLPQMFWLVSGALILLILALFMVLVIWFNKKLIKPKL
jgi:integral membrane protein (TIGR01906 family)